MSTDTTEKLRRYLDELRPLLKLTAWLPTRNSRPDAPIRGDDRSTSPTPRKVHMIHCSFTAQNPTDEASLDRLMSWLTTRSVLPEPTVLDPVISQTPTETEVSFDATAFDGWATVACDFTMATLMGEKHWA